MSFLSQTPPLGGLSPPQGVFQGHAAHLAEWSATLRPKGSWGTCIPQGVTTFFHTAFTAHSDAGAEAIGRRLQCLVRHATEEEALLALPWNPPPFGHRLRHAYRGVGWTA